jgi:hypothetical protein
MILSQFIESIAFIVILGCGASEAGYGRRIETQGKYEPLNTNNVNNAKSTDESKLFFSNSQNRAPHHDTPSSECNCRK